MGSDQPFYGLQPQGLNGDQPPLTSIEDMAALYIQEIQTIQPNSPYFLSGYSLGGIIAYEVAQQLQKQGQTVSFLGMIDTALRGSIQRESLMKRMFIHMKNIVQFDPSYLSKKLVGWTHWGKDRIRDKYNKYINLLGIDLPEGDKHINIMDANLEALNAYTFKPYLGQIALLRTDDNNEDSPDLAVGVQSDPLFGWGNLVSAVDLHYIPGSHITLFDEPHVQVMADKLKGSLEKVG